MGVEVGVGVEDGQDETSIGEMVEILTRRHQDDEAQTDMRAVAVDGNWIHTFHPDLVNPVGIRIEVAMQQDPSVALPFEIRHLPRTLALANDPRIEVLRGRKADLALPIEAITEEEGG